MIMRTLFSLLGLCCLAVTGYGQTVSEKKEVLQVVQRLFDAMATQDTLAAKNTLLPDGQLFAVQQRGDSTYIGRRTNGQFVRGLANKERIIDERMREKEVQVQIHQQLAMVWAPYDLWVNKKFSHCGVDIFTLIKTKQGWKIASLAYTVEPGGCKDVPQQK
jgi:hypothetical protein